MACEELQATLMSKAQALGLELETKTKALGDEIRTEAEGIDPDINTTGMDVWVGLEVDIGWKRVDFSLDLPQVTIRDQTWALDLPQVTVENKEIIFHTPSIRMKTVKTGEYPEVTCDWKVGWVLGVRTKRWECTTRWSPIYMDVPEPFPQEQRIVIGLPEFRMERTEFVLGVPEFRMETTAFALHLPQITVKEISVEAKAAEKKGQELSRRAEAEAEALKSEFVESARQKLAPDVTGLFYCYERDLSERRNQGLAKFDEGINLLQAVISSMVSSKVDEANDNLIRMRASLATALAARETFATEIEAKFKDLHAQQENFFKQLVGEAPPPQ